MKELSSSENKKVFCSKCKHHYIYVACNDSGYDTCRAIKIIREDGISRSSRDGDCEENKNNDCKLFIPRTPGQLFKDKWKCWIYAAGFVAFIGFVIIATGIIYNIVN